MAEQPADRGEIAIGVAIDDKYAPHFATCAASIASSRGRESVRFFVLQGPTLSTPTVSALRDFIRDLGMEFETVPVTDDVAASMPRTPNYPPIVWHRLLIPELLPALGRILLLDADVLVLQSLWPLYDSIVQPKLLSAVGTTSTLVGTGDPQRFIRLGLDPGAPYLNTGVMLMDLEAMRAEQVGPRAIAFGHQRGAELQFPEQDALNVVANGDWNLLQPKWNALSHLWLRPADDDVTYSRLDYELARHSPAIVHFEGPSVVKPWHHRSIHPFRFLYRDVRAATPWPLAELEGKSLSSSVLRRLPLRSQYAIAGAKRRLFGRSAHHEQPADGA